MWRKGVAVAAGKDIESLGLTVRVPRVDPELRPYERFSMKVGLRANALLGACTELRGCDLRTPPPGPFVQAPSTYPSLSVRSSAWPSATLALMAAQSCSMRGAVIWSGPQRRVLKIGNVSIGSPTKT